MAVATSPGCGCPKQPLKSPTADESTAEANQPPEEVNAEVESTEGERTHPTTIGSESGNQSERSPEISAPNAMEIGDARPGDSQGNSSPETTGAASKPQDQQSAANSGTPQPKGNPTAARQEARKRLAAAEEAATNGDSSKAFQEALRGWQAVAPFEGDADCRRLTAELRTQLEKLGRQANAGVSIDSSKPLVVE